MSMEHDEASRHQSARTKAKILETVRMLKKHFEQKYGIQVDAYSEMELFNALNWAADDVYAQDHQDKPKK